MWRRRIGIRRTFVPVGLVLVMVGCGGDGEKASDTGRTAEIPTTVPPATTTSLTVTTDTGTGSGSTSTRVTLPTTLAGTPADFPVDADSIPEKVNVSVSTGKSVINGISYTNALILEPSPYNTPNRVEINAGRTKTRFLGDLGIPDEESSSSAYKVDISFDNAAAAYSTEVRFGETKKLDLEVKDVLRIKISITSIASAGSRCCAALAIGDPRLR